MPACVGCGGGVFVPRSIGADVRAEAARRWAAPEGPDDQDRGRHVLADAFVGLGYGDVSRSLAKLILFHFALSWVRARHRCGGPIPIAAYHVYARCQSVNLNWQPDVTQAGPLAEVSSS